jgi:tetratricopeptide (TPR) repeat protein
LNRADELSYASACTLRGLIELDILNTEKALEYFHEGLAIREKLLPADDAFIASSLNAISIAYTELGKMNEAIDAGNRAIQIRLDTKSDRIGNSYSNMSSTLLRVGNFDGAEEMLARCPSLKDFTDETFLRSGNPRFAG